MTVLDIDSLFSIYFLLVISSPLIAFHLPSFSTDTEVFFLDFTSKISHGFELSICLTSLVSDTIHGKVLSVQAVRAEESAHQPCAATCSNKE